MIVPRILIVDGEYKLRRTLHAKLRMHGYTVLESRTGGDALKMIRTTRPDLILFDINLPETDGMEICRRIRGSSDAPIIVVTARKAPHDKVFALDAGADDYVVKPFEWEELLARIRAFLRRYLPSETTSSFANGNMTVDFERRQVTVRGRTVHLGPKEFHLLKCLVAHKGKVVAHRDLFHALWGPRNHGNQDNLRVVINQLRKKIEMDPARPQFIQTDPWVGYRFYAPADSRRAAPRNNN